MNEDGFRRPHVRAQFVTGDGAVILMRYTGLVEQTAAFSKISPRTGTINTCVFQSNLPRMTSKYRWLEQSLFVAAGRLLGTGKIEYALYRMT